MQLSCVKSVQKYKITLMLLLCIVTTFDQKQREFPKPFELQGLNLVDDVDQLWFL